MINKLASLLDIRRRICTSTCVCCLRVWLRIEQKFDLNKEPSDSSQVEDDGNVRENHDEFCHSPKMNDDLKGKDKYTNIHYHYGADGLASETKEYHRKQGDYWLADCVKKKL